MMFFSPSRIAATPGLWRDWREDVACVFARDPAARGWLEVLLAYPGVHAVLLYRVTHRLWLADWKLTARLLAAFARWLTNVDIHPGATIGKRFFIDHGACVVIGETAEIGNDVTMYHGVTLGGTTWNKEKRHPTLGDNVLIGAGAKILGAITLGNNVRVGANSVVIKDVPACCTVIGIPGRIIQQKGVKIQDPRGIDLDHHLVPDPVGKAINCLVERLDELENNQKRFVVAEETCGSCEAEGVCHGEESPVKLRTAAGGK
ncbi:serine O-acetyltransferase [Methylomonas sp. MED-D]|uniref:serine O-acetyltransferase n=1 Tax=Methylomonas koyamae TaxID=702114 RepID=A0A177N5I5_9GAMM|nr:MULTISPECIES: serine O-acetyltransferase [Methylomonas]MDT4330192.1 serine O-acetyltransferase [Methylomonas sp. MV1]OAI13162.1 serine acetyltransferase [Methylomonas koyamae]OHX38237.1 serine O-acetyltransferase [Methylomonas sp. LWB]WGS86670.1 serine O-acetyltransferase [Methylomonas sp. UP202]